MRDYQEEKMRSIIVFAICFLMLYTGSYAMIETLSLSELVSGADLIVIGKTVTITTVETKPEGYTVIDNLFEVQECLKGQIPEGGQIKITTLSGIEDSTEFIAGEKFLLFLQKYENQYIVFNSPQGGWPINADGTFSRMGTGTTLEQVKAAIK